MRNQPEQQEVLGGAVHSWQELLVHLSFHMFDMFADMPMGAVCVLVHCSLQPAT
jgi:hypothetical protein